MTKDTFPVEERTTWLPLTASIHCGTWCPGGSGKPAVENVKDKQRERKMKAPGRAVPSSWPRAALGTWKRLLQPNSGWVCIQARLRLLSPQGTLGKNSGTLKLTYPRNIKDLVRPMVNLTRFTLTDQPGGGERFVHFIAEETEVPVEFRDKD